MSVTSEMRAALYEKYPSQEYAVLFEVGKSTGAGTSGWADAIAMSLWPSRGLGIHGFEIKAYRGDWLREMKNPAKADFFVSLCDYWSIVATEGIVKPEELPPTWGLLELSKGKLVQRVAAPKLAGAGPTLQRTFVAALLRRAGEADRGTVNDMVRKEVDRMMAIRQESIDREVESRTREASELIAKVDEIKKLTGIDLKSWTPSDQVAAAMRFAMTVDLYSKYGGLRDLAKDMAASAARIETLLADVVPKVET